MRVSRRRALGFGAAGFLALAGARIASSRPRGSDAVARIEVGTQRIDALLPDRPDQRTFGSLTYRGGLILTSPSDSFGGFSALWRSGDGRDLVSVSDNAMWLTARVSDAQGRISGLTDVAMAPLLDVDGTPLWQTEAFDTESLAIADGVAFVGIERVHEIRRFAWARDGFAARGEQVPVPPEVKDLPSNASLEAVGIAPPGHPLAGALIAIAEEARPGDTAPTRGWILSGSRPGAFDVARSDNFDITDIAFLESGEALLLERRFTVRTGVACRIRRLAPDAIRPGALVDGPIVFDVDRHAAIDNMEGIAIHRDPASKDTVVTLISDDNFNPFQKTVLLEFTLG